MKNKTIERIKDIIRSYGLDCWLIYSDEDCDPYFRKYISNKLSSASFCIITASECFIIAHSLDFENLEKYENVNNLKYSSSEAQNIDDVLADVFKKLGFPSSISLSYSTLKDPLVDVLGHGTFLHLTEAIKKIYAQFDKIVSFNSSEKIIYALSDRKEEGEIEKLKIAANRANEILDTAFSKIKAGMTEKDIVKLVHDIFDTKPAYFTSYKITKEEYSWPKEQCPIVLAGPSLMKGGHAEASDLKIEPGFTIYFDFGVKLHFEDESFFSSDIQRMGYVLKENEREAPESIKRMFNTLYESITLGIENLRPGKKGYEIDELVRSYIKNAGYIDYDHSTGHAVGETTHSPGTLLGVKNDGLSQLDIQPNGVYTIEPRIPVDNGGSIEEMVVATTEGGKAISPRQAKLYLIK